MAVLLTILDRRSPFWYLNGASWDLSRETVTRSTQQFLNRKLLMQKKAVTPYCASSGGQQQRSSCLPKLVGAAVIAESLGYSRKHVYALAKMRRIPHARFEGSVRFDPEKVRKWLDNHNVDG